MNKLTKKVIEKLTIEAVAAEGKCIVRVEGQVVFVPGNLVVPGDVVDLRITGKKKKFLEGVPVHFHSYAQERTSPFCSHFGVCGGCKWQHLPYEIQLKYKQQQVVDHLQRIAKIKLPGIPPILPAPRQQYYRNKLEFTFSDWRWLEKWDQQTSPEPGLGFHIPGQYDKVLDIQHCYLQDDISNQLRLGIKQYALEKKLEFFNLKKQEGFLRSLILRNTSLGQWMVIPIFFEERGKEIHQMLEFIQENFPTVTSIFYIINAKKNDTVHDLLPVHFSGQQYIEEEMEGLRFRIGPKSFYQTNSEQAFELYKIVREFAGLRGSELVYDLYTGTGTIANFVARHCKKVIGLEYVEEAVADAKINAKLNRIDNAEFYAGDIKDLLTTEALEKWGRPEVVISDPPRAGMHEDVVRSLLSIAPRKIVYVSCNPATQARDLILLDEKYEVVRIQPVDMFPQTHHVENVLLLVEKEREA